MTKVDAAIEDASGLLTGGNSLILPAVEGKVTQSDVVNHIRSLDEVKYQHWYAQARSVVSFAMPDRLNEFDELYRNSSRREASYANYVISDWFAGIRLPGNFSHELKIYRRVRSQLAILSAASKLLASNLNDIQGLIRAEMFDDDLDEAKYLLKNGHLRAAGALAGVVIERHLKDLCQRHGVNVRKSRPSIGDLNTLLKAQATIPLEEFQRIQYLASLRNLCDHDRDRNPSKEQVVELIDGAERLVKIIH